MDTDFCSKNTERKRKKAKEGDDKEETPHSKGLNTLFQQHNPTTA